MFGRKKKGCLGSLLSMIGLGVVLLVLAAFIFADDDDSYDYGEYTLFDEDYDDWFISDSGDYDYISSEEIAEGSQDVSLDDLIDAFFSYYGYYPEDSGDYYFQDNDGYSDYRISDYDNEDDYDQFYGGSGTGSGGSDSYISNEPASELAEKFIACAKKWLGTPYVYGGTSRSGIDCSGLIYMAAKEAGLGTLPRNSRSMYSICTQIKKSELRPGDLVFFAASSSITHVALYVADNTLLHAVSDGPKTGVIYTKLSDNYWKNHYYSSGRIISDTVTAKRSEARNLANARARQRSVESNSNQRTED